MKKTLGYIIFFLTFVTSSYYIFFQSVEIPKVMAFMTGGAVFGILFILGDYIESIKIIVDGPKITAEIKATAQEVHSYAEQIKTILGDIQAHKDTIDLIMRDANIVHEKSRRG